jgi:hypothetical protein
MDIATILAVGRQIWGDRRMTLDEITVVIGVVYGDICRQTRAMQENEAIDHDELQKEFGNLIVSVVRWCDDLGYDVQECLEKSITAQKQYVEQHNDQ